MKKGTLVLEDGSRYVGVSLGEEKSTAGNVIFHTGMLGHPEALTDPMYAGSITVLAYPVVANNGVPADSLDLHRLLKFFESGKIHARAVILSSYNDEYSHWNSTRSLSEWLKEQKIPGLYDVDTRSLCRKLMSRPSMQGKLIFGDDDPAYPSTLNLVKEVSTPEVRDFRPLHYYAKTAKKILAIDCGITNSMIKLFLLSNIHLQVVPWDYDISKQSFDGLFISSGPGNPNDCKAVIENVRKALELEGPDMKPILGVGLGHQIMALALGAKVDLMPSAHRGLNIPCLDLRSGRCYITAQNHAYAVDEKTLPPDWQPLFFNLNDRTNGGLTHLYKPFSSVQFIPEASARPDDTAYVVKQFVDRVQGTPVRVTTLPVQRIPSFTKVLVLGQRGVTIGRSGELDYLGCQVIRALQEEQIETILLNPNVATNSTTSHPADKVYYMPVEVPFIKELIQKERPDGIVLTAGGLGAMKIGLALAEEGFLEEYGVQVLGTAVESLHMVGKRDGLGHVFKSLDLPVIPTEIVSTTEEAAKAASTMEFPVRVGSKKRSHYVYDSSELAESASELISTDGPITLEKSLKGWKLIEYEVMRDWMDGCISVVDMESLDPVGIKSAHSISVCPSQTLGTQELGILQTAALKIIRHFNIVGSCNIKFAIYPGTLDYYVLSVAPRLSRSTALASKATGYPIAYLATKLALGQILSELKNPITGLTAATEPVLDYCVVKVPSSGIPHTQAVLYGTQGERQEMGQYSQVMAVGRNFEEAFQKALRMAYKGAYGISGYPDASPRHEDDICDDLINVSDNRMFAIFEALGEDFSVDEIYSMTKIDRRFLFLIERLHSVRDKVANYSLLDIPKDVVQEAKRVGFSDDELGAVLNCSSTEVRTHRKSLGIVPSVKKMDTAAGQVDSIIDLLYVTYGGTGEHDVAFDSPGYMVCGSGTYNLGRSIEFDWCTMQCINTLKESGHKAIVVNYNPQAVSTDYHNCDRLYFDELNTERLLDINDLENPHGIFCCFGGPLADGLAVPLAANGAKIMGTDTEHFKRVKSASLFAEGLDSLGIARPQGEAAHSSEEALAAAKQVGYPCLIDLAECPLQVVQDEAKLKKLLDENRAISAAHPARATKFIEDAKVIDFDAVAQNGTIIIHSMSEHLNRVQTYGGDSTLVLPPQNVFVETQRRVVKIGLEVAAAMSITGPFRLQFLLDLESDGLMLCKCDLRASSIIPLASKVCGEDFVAQATKAMLGEHCPIVNINFYEMEYAAVKAPATVASSLQSVDPVFGMQVTSTGELACFGQDLEDAYLLALIATGFRLSSVPGHPASRSGCKILLNIEHLHSQMACLEAVGLLVKMGYLLYAQSTSLYIDNQLSVEEVSIGDALPYLLDDNCPSSPSSGGSRSGLSPVKGKTKGSLRSPQKMDFRGPKDALRMLRSKEVSLLIDIPNESDPNSVAVSHALRRTAANREIPYITSLECCQLLARALYKTSQEERNPFPCRSYQDYTEMTWQWRTNLAQYEHEQDWV